MRATSLIPNPCESYEDWQRSEHRDLAELDPAIAWAELTLLRRHVARLIWTKARRLPIVRTTPAGHNVNEREWCIERIAHLERLLALKRRAA